MSRGQGRWTLWLACVGLLALGGATWGNEPPGAADAYVTVVRNASESFRLSATDLDIDPLAPEAHPIRFLLIAGPSHGALAGDLAAVAYGAPHEAYVDLAYVPASGYVGPDEITFIAVDLFEAASAVATVEIDVVDGREEGLLAGSWDAEFTFNIQTPEVTAFSQRLTEVYRIGGLTVKGVAEFAMESAGGDEGIVFDALRFEAEASVGDLSLESKLAFDPEAEALAGLFDYLQTIAQVQLFGVTLVHTLYLTVPQTDSYQVLSMQGTAGGVSFLNSLRLELEEDCGFVLAHDDAYAAWSWCDVQFRAAAAFAPSGFERLTLTASGISVPQFSWLPGEISLDAVLTFTPESKALAVTLDWTLARSACLYVLGELGIGGPADATMQGVSLYGLVFECEIADGVRAKSATSFVAAKNAVLTGQVDYFESITLTGELSSCCGIPGAWSAATYFAHDSTQLFDWGMSVFKADVAISEHFSVRLDVAIRSGELGDPRAEFTFGWTARW